MFQSTPSGGKATWFVAAITPPATCFNPRLPGGRRRVWCGYRADHKTVSIHAFRGEGDRVMTVTNITNGVSIHAFRGEGDQVADERALVPPCFNPRLPGGRRPVLMLDEYVTMLFQSTPSGGKATLQPVRPSLDRAVSIHAFRGEGDGGGRGRRSRSRRFNPRLPGGRRPAPPTHRRHSRPVSIHAFRGEGDHILDQLAHRCLVSIHAFRGEGD